MSWQLFKQNILAVANRPEGIPDIDTIAKLYADEYDAAVKRGGDLLHGIPINSGNKLVMEQFFKLALQKGLSATGPYDLVGEMGNGVKAYWAGARMKTTGTRPGQPLPILPPVPKVTSIQLNVVLNNGIWIPPIPTLNANIADTNVIGAPQTPPQSHCQTPTVSPCPHSLLSPVISKAATSCPAPAWPPTAPHPSLASSSAPAERSRAKAIT